MTDAQELLFTYLWHRLSTLLADSGVADFEPRSMDIKPDGDTLTVTVRSFSQGTIPIGTIGREQLDAGVAAVTNEQIEAYRERTG